MPSIVCALEGDTSILRKFSGQAIGAASDESMEKCGKKRHVTRDEHVARFSFEHRRDETGIVVRLQSLDGRALGKRIEAAQARFSGLPSAKLATVPDHGGPGPVRVREFGHALGLLLSAGRERTHVVNMCRYGVGVMDEKQKLSH